MRFIEGIQVDNPFFLAPMAGVTDYAFRSVCAQKGAALCYTEMVSAKALCYNDKKTATLLEIADSHRPCFVQIFGSEPDICAKGALLALQLSHADGVDINMAVVTKDGIVGFVSEVGTNWCKVSTLLENAVSVGAYIPRSGAIGMVSGDLSVSSEGYCRFSYTEADADIRVGDQILSSGVGSVYPADLIIGVVESIEVDEYSRAIVATVKPSVEFSKLQYMLIVTGYEQS